MNDGRGNGQILPMMDSAGQNITYREYDVNPFTPGVNRGPERLVVGSDGSAYYTADHYITFMPVP
jgi:guanyl-specific ribonuclease Sa